MGVLVHGNPLLCEALVAADSILSKPNTMGSWMHTEDVFKAELSFMSSCASVFHVDLIADCNTTRWDVAGKSAVYR
jgi:hypothetical protein